MKTQKFTYPALLLLISSFIVTAQPPDWAVPNVRRMMYDDKEYLVGFASEPNQNKENPAEILKRVENYAKAQVVEYIQVTVKSETSREVTETNKSFMENFSSMYSSSSTLNLTGLKVESTYDQKGKTGYALAVAKRSELLGYYKNLVNTSLNDAEIKLKSAQESMSSNNGEQALKFSLDAIALIPQVEQAQSVVVALMRGSAGDAETQVTRLSNVKTDIEDVMRKVQRSGGNTIDDISFFIARGLKLQKEALNAPVTLSNFTYQDTKIGSELSNRLNQSLASKLVSTAGYNVITAGSHADGYILTGTYWKEPNDLKLIATLKTIDGSLVATSEAYLPLSWVDATNVKYLPENFEEAYSRMRAFNKDEVIKGDLNVEIWTNKGNENLLYTEGERLKFFIRANKECYIRLIYHMADNQSVLLMDNYYVASNMTNKVIELPDEFECSEPFGVETLQVNVQTEQFASLRTKNVDGYQFIDESLNDILIGTRGLKRVMDKPVEKAEKRIVFTTMRK